MSIPDRLSNLPLPVDVDDEPEFEIS